MKRAFQIPTTDWFYLFHQRFIVQVGEMSFIFEWM